MKNLSVFIKTIGQKLLGYVALSLLFLLITPLLLGNALHCDFWVKGSPGLIPEINKKGWIFITLFYLITALLLSTLIIGVA